MNKLIQRALFFVLTYLFIPLATLHLGCRRQDLLRVTSLGAQWLQ